jgi:hypothetical protein
MVEQMAMAFGEAGKAHGLLEVVRQARIVGLQDIEPIAANRGVGAGVTLTDALFLLELPDGVFVAVIQRVERGLGLGLQPGHDGMTAGQQDDLDLHVQGITIAVGVPKGLVQPIAHALPGLGKLAIEVRFGRLDLALAHRRD